MIWLYDLFNIGLVLGAFVLGCLIIFLIFTQQFMPLDLEELAQLSPEQLDEVLFYFRNMKLAEYGEQRKWQ